MSKLVSDPAAVNKFKTEQEAAIAARVWSRDRKEMWTVIHAPSDEGGLMYFVERGDGGMIRNSERVVGRWEHGRKVSA